MIDQEQRVCRFKPCDRTQRHLRARRRPHIDVMQRGGILPVLRCDLHDDMILIERRIQNGHLALAERIIQRVVDELRAETQTRRRTAIEHDERLLSLVLLIAVHIGNLGQGPQLVPRPSAPKY